MLEQTLTCLVDTADAARPLYAVRPAGLAGFLDTLSEAQSNFLRQLDFTAGAEELAFLPGSSGVAGAVVGLGDDRSPTAFGNLAFRLPDKPGRYGQINNQKDHSPACAKRGEGPKQASRK